MRTNIIRKSLSDSNVTNHVLRNKDDMDVAVRVSKFGDMTFVLIYTILSILLAETKNFLQNHIVVSIGGCHDAT